MRFLLVFLIMLSVLFGCGGGEKEPESDLRITDMPAVKSSTIYSGSAETLSATANCNSGVDCIINSITVTWLTDTGQRITKTTPYNKIVGSKKSETLTFTVLTDSDRVFAPLTYLKDDNPSKSQLNYTSYTETIGEIRYTKTGLSGRTGCTSDSTTTTCTRFENVPTYDYTKGTIRFTDFVLSLSESASFGALTGDGSGLYNSTTRTWLLIFNKGIAEGREIYAMYISPLLPLNNIPSGRDVKIFYGNLTLQQDSSDRLVSSSVVYGSVIGRQIEITRAMGFRNAPITVQYSGEPIRRFGGELLGKAGTNCSGNICRITLQKSNPSIASTALIKPTSLQVFTQDKTATVQSYDPNSGQLIATFNPATPLRNDEDISVSYVFSFLSIPLYIDIDTSYGRKSFIVRLEITRN